jgi:hypothetical protein
MDDGTKRTHLGAESFVSLTVNFSNLHRTGLLRPILTAIKIAAKVFVVEKTTQNNK